MKMRASVSHLFAIFDYLLFYADKRFFRALKVPEMAGDGGELC